MPYIAWIPEAPFKPETPTPLYAMDDLGRYTLDVWKALRFETREECQRWCDEHPNPVYFPVCHELG